jgi:signal peptidase I
MKHFSAKVELCRGALAAGTPLRLRIRGTSMLPALWPGDVVSIRPIRLDDVRPGEIAVFVRNRHFVVHRVIRASEDGGVPAFVTRGDAQRCDDPPVAASALLGVVETVHRFGRSRPLPRRPPLFSRAVAWTVQRSPGARRFLDRLNSVRHRNT